ncbi:MAG: hypothetical protein K9J25_08000 [Bacteroidales bacterium]|nr:hypothetical protein [Bacteroidales bacterium]
MKEVNDYVSYASNFIYIYGMQDTWSATGVELNENSSSIKVMKRGGDHRTRIKNLPETRKSLVLNTLNSWLGE